MIKKRKQAMIILLLTALCAHGSGLYAAPLAEGDAAPHLSFRDIDGRQGSSEEYQTRIIVYSFADRNSNKELTAWVEKAGLEVARRHPEFKIAYINFADVSAVPRLFRHVVEPILRHINEKTNKKSRDFYQRQGVNQDPERFAFHLIPDWDGEYLKVFGIKDAALYRCWIVVNDLVVATLDPSIPDIEKRFIEIFDNLAVSRHQDRS